LLLLASSSIPAPVGDPILISAIYCNYHPPTPQRLALTRRAT
jgi:hypothetical protein